jgi:outer membrane protein OmpA-like peptidoglycan-associated protein
MAFDNKTLIISFSEKEESPINDLYVSFLQPNGRWSEPVSFGDTVNTKDDETTPFLAADGVSLYFSSNRKGGLGSNDIYMCKRLDNTWRKWSKPINLGAPINTKDWDAYYTIPASGDLAYLVSYQNSLGKGDIVRVKTKTATKPKPVILIKGKVLDAKTNLPVEAEITYELLPSGEKVGVAEFISKNGDYVLVLPYGKNYGITAKAIGYVPISLNYDLTVENKYKEIKKDLMLVPFEKGSVVRLNNLFFDSGKATLKKESYPEIERLIQLLKDNADVEIEIAGHTDDIGSDNDNLILSGNRSAAVKEYIISKGIAEGRINCRGYGEYKSIVKNDTEENRQLNRRVEFKIITK